MKDGSPLFNSYYGDEIGMPGGNDPDNRHQMCFDQLSEKEQETSNAISRMIHLRRKSLPLIYGSTEIIEETEQTLVLKRSYFGESVIVLFNKAKTDATLLLDKQALNGAKEVFSYFGSNSRRIMWRFRYRPTIWGWCPTRDIQPKGRIDSSISDQNEVL